MNPSPDVSGHPARILIVDDERQNRQLLEIMLAPEGFVLLTAASGEEALAMVALEAPDLILLDIMMPRMDGYQAVARIKGNLATRNIPVIMLTAAGRSRRQDAACRAPEPRTILTRARGSRRTVPAGEEPPASGTGGHGAG